MILVKTIKTIKTIMMMSILAAAAFGQNQSPKEYSLVDLKDYVLRPAAYQGRLVEITADVVSVNADHKSLDIFDSRSKALIGVSIAQLSRTQRQSLILEPVHRVSVFGRVERKNGVLAITADRVIPLSANLVARH